MTTTNYALNGPNPLPPRLSPIPLKPIRARPSPYFGPTPADLPPISPHQALPPLALLQSFLASVGPFLRPQEHEHKETPCYSSGISA